jgi:hypothetical protein
LREERGGDGEPFEGLGDFLHADAGIVAPSRERERCLPSRARKAGGGLPEELAKVARGRAGGINVEGKGKARSRRRGRRDEVAEGSCEQIECRAIKQAVAMQETALRGRTPVLIEGRVEFERGGMREQFVEEKREIEGEMWGGAGQDGGWIAEERGEVCGRLVRNKCEGNAVGDFAVPVSDPRGGRRVERHRRALQEKRKAPALSRT